MRNNEKYPRSKALTSRTCTPTIGPPHPSHPPIRHKTHLPPSPRIPIKDIYTNLHVRYLPHINGPHRTTTATTAALAAQSPPQLTFPIGPAPRPLLANQAAHASSRQAADVSRAAPTTNALLLSQAIR